MSNNEENSTPQRCEITLTNWDGEIPIENSPLNLIPNLGRNLSRNEILSENRLSRISVCSNEHSERNVHGKRNNAAASSNGTLSVASSSVLSSSTMEIVIEDLQDEGSPTSALLSYCKRRFLRPYMIILTIVGLNPISTEATLWSACCSYMYTIVLFLLLVISYFLQYLCSYRGDRGFVNSKISHHEFLHSLVGIQSDITELCFSHIIPNCLHLMGYVSFVIVIKILDHEQLQNLIERVFIMSMKPRRLCTILWCYLAGGLIMLGIIIGFLIPNILQQNEIIKVEWFAAVLREWKICVKSILLASIILQYLVELSILCSYCVECCLLRSHLSMLSQKLIMNSIDSLDWMREVLEFRKLLDHLNQKISIPICFFVTMNLAYAFAGIIYLFMDLDYNYTSFECVIVLLWLFLGMFPFFMAASVTRECNRAQASGHHIRARPFLYHNTPSEDLNSTLLFASSLQMSAKLFRMPIQSNYLCFVLLVIGIVILTLGLCLNLS